MENIVRGTSILTISNFVKEKFGEDYNKFIETLYIDSKKIYTNNIIHSKWYSFKWGMKIPMLIISDMFYCNDYRKCAKELGFYTAEQTLTGIYKFFIQLGSPNFIISKANYIFKYHFKNTIIEVKLNEIKHIIVSIKDFDEINEMTEYNIGAWIEKSLIISGCNGIKIKMMKQLSISDNETLYDITWL